MKEMTDFSEKVFKYLTTIPAGKVVTYGQIAEAIGNKNASRAVGNALHKNPDGDKYPCYKVVNSTGRLARDFVFGGIGIQRERLEKDGIEVVNNTVDLKKYQYFDEALFKARAAELNIFEKEADNEYYG